MNRSALISAIENENFDLMVILLENNIEVGDALLHAISEEYVEAVEELLQWEETNHKEGQPYVGYVCLCPSATHFRYLARAGRQWTAPSPPSPWTSRPSFWPPTGTTMRF